MAMADLDAAQRLMSMTLRSYYARLAKNDDSAESDGLRMRFAGEKFMLEALAGPEQKRKVLDRLRAEGLTIPHCGDRVADGFIGFDTDADR